MASESSTSESRETAERRPSRLGRFLSWPLTVLRYAAHKPLMAVFITCGTSIIVAAGVSVVYFKVIYSAVPEQVPTVGLALEQLDAGQYDAARKTSMRLHLLAGDSYRKQAAPLFVLGAALAHEATEHWNETERRTLYLVAARYLEEAHERGFPAGREGQGLYLLATCLFHSGHYAASLPILHAALEAVPRSRYPLYGMLASAYFLDGKPKLDQALRFNRLALADPSLTLDQRYELVLRQSRILLAQGETASARKTLAQLPADVPVADQVTLMQARLRIAEADRLHALGNSSDVDRTAYESKYHEAIRLLERAQSQDESGETTRRARYLIGICYRKLNDGRAAELAFSRTRRSHYHTPEALAARLAEAEIQLAQQRYDVALESFLDVIAESEQPDNYRNEWVPLEQLRKRLDVAYQRYRDADQFGQAIVLSRALNRIFPLDRALEDEARAHRAWANFLIRQADSQGSHAADVTRAEARIQFRLAGAAFERLSQLRFATRKYPEDLWESGHAFLLGHNYAMAARLMRRYLKNTPSGERARALVALGNALLSLGQIDAALQALTECVEFHPKHPETYTARLIASRAYEELNEIEKAKKMLLFNLHFGDLTPESTQWRASLFAYGRLLFKEAMVHEATSRKQQVNSADTATRKKALPELERAHALFQEAIEQLETAIQRDPDASSAVEARYMIAEAWRQSAKFPRKSIPVEPTQARRNALLQQMRGQLREAALAHRHLLEFLNRRQEQTDLSDVERGILRNTYFAHADALFDLGEYELAIKAYSAATNRYQHEPESIEAFMQIASCYRLMQSHGEARATLMQAAAVLNRIRADADFKKTTRYDRNQWKHLIAWLSAS